MAQQEKQTPELLQFELADPEEFNNSIATNAMTSQRLERQISDLFSPAFDDYEGCKIIQVGNGLKCKIYFNPVQPTNKVQDAVYAVKFRGEYTPNRINQGPAYDIVNRTNQQASQKQFELTEEAKEMLAEFLMIPVNEAKIVERFNSDIGRNVNVRLPKNWNQYTEEVSDIIKGTGMQNIYLAVTLDLQLIVAKIYGKKDAKEVQEAKKRGAIPRDKYEYHVRVVRTIVLQNNSYILEIQKVNKQEIAKLVQEIGLGNNIGTIPMYHVPRT